MKTRDAKSPLGPVGHLLFCGLALAMPRLCTGAAVVVPSHSNSLSVHLWVPRVPLSLNLSALRAAIDLPPAVLGRYEGCYQFSDTAMLTVTRQGDDLFGQEPGLDRVELFARNEYRFFIKVIDAQVEFVPSLNGRASAALWRQGGRTQRGERVADAGATSLPETDTGLCQGPAHAPSFVLVHPRIHRVLST